MTPNQVHTVDDALAYADQQAATASSRYLAAHDDIVARTRVYALARMICHRLNDHDIYPSCRRCEKRAMDLLATPRLELKP